MATLLFQMQQHRSIVSVLSGPSTEYSLENESTLKLRAIAEALSTDNKANHTRAVHLAQKNIMIRPSNADNWRILAIVGTSTK